MGRRRSVSIYADSMEEYMETISKEKEANKEADDDIKELEKEEEELYSDLGGLKLVDKIPRCKKDDIEYKTVEVEEKELFDQLHNLNEVYKSNKKENMNKKKKEHGLNILCSYFKDSIKHANKMEKSKSQLVIYSSRKNKKKSLKAMSNNAIHDIDMKEAVDTIIKVREVEEEETQPENSLKGSSNIRSSYFSYHSSSSTSMSKDILMQNVECEEEVMKVMLVGSTLIGKTKLINNFLESRRNTYIPSSGLEIKKKIVRILNKKVRIEFFDTDANFHLKEASKIYYKLCDAFLYIIDCTKIDSLQYIQNVHPKIFDSACSNNFLLVALNSDSITQDFKQTLNSFSNDFKLTLFPLTDIDNFHIKTENVAQLFSKMLIKKNNKKNKNKCVRNVTRCLSNCTSSHEKFENFMFGYNNHYHIENYVEEEEDLKTLGSNSNAPININLRRRWSYI